MTAIASKLGWLLLALFGAFCLGTLALHRGETINAFWLVAATLSVFFIAYRFYARFIADKALGLDATRATPAVLRNDGLDYVPTDRMGRVRPSFRRDRGRGSARRAGARGADGLSARHAVDPRRRRVRRRRAGFHDPVPVVAPRRPLARRDGARRARRDGRHHRDDRRADDHVHRARRARARRRQGARGRARGARSRSR